MQYDPSKQGYNNHANQYPPANQPPQFRTDNTYPPNNALPPSAPYPQQPPGTAYYGQASAYNPQYLTVTPGYQSGNLLLTPMTSNLKVFLFISGSLYLIWGILDISLNVALFRTAGTYHFFSGFWGSGYFIGGGIFMLVAASKISYVTLYLLQMFIVTLVFSVLGIILSIASVILSFQTTGVHIALIVVFVISTVHTIVNIIMIITSRNTTMLTSTSNVPGNTVSI